MAVPIVYRAATTGVKRAWSRLFNAAKQSKKLKTATGVVGGTVVVDQVITDDSSARQAFDKLVDYAKEKGISFGESLEQMFSETGSTDPQDVSAYNEVMTWANQHEVGPALYAAYEKVKEERDNLTKVLSQDYGSDDIQRVGPLEYHAKTESEFVNDLVVEDAYALVRSRFGVRMINALLQIIPILQQPDGADIFDQLEERYVRTRH